MAQADKPIRLSGHARGQLFFRGGTEQDVVEAIRTAPWQPAELGRLESRRDFPFDAEWKRTRYATSVGKPS
jgi:hypothetical protein